LNGNGVNHGSDVSGLEVQALGLERRLLRDLPLAGRGPEGDHERRIVSELERKLAWAIGTTFNVEWKRRGAIAEVARKISLHLVIELGPPS
jgi:hypothetical protein